jgi:hypothetical protein
MNTTTIKTQIASLQSALTTVLADPGPNYTISGPSGSRSINKADYIAQIIAQLTALQELLIANEPYEESTRVIV